MHVLLKLPSFKHEILYTYFMNLFIKKQINKYIYALHVENIDL